MEFVVIARDTAWPGGKDRAGAADHALAQVGPPSTCSWREVRAMPASVALVATDRPECYAKQLTEQLGRRNAPVTEAGGTGLIFTTGSRLLSAGPGGLLLTAHAEDDAGSR